MLVLTLSLFAYAETPDPNTAEPAELVFESFDDCVNQSVTMDPSSNPWDTCAAQFPSDAWSVVDERFEAMLTQCPLAASKRAMRKLVKSQGGSYIPASIDKKYRPELAREAFRVRGDSARSLFSFAYGDATNTEDQLSDWLLHRTDTARLLATVVADGRVPRPREGSSLLFNTTCESGMEAAVEAKANIPVAVFESSVSGSSSVKDSLAVAYGTFDSPIGLALANSQDPVARVNSLMALWNHYTVQPSLLEKPHMYLLAFSGWVITNVSESKRRSELSVNTSASGNWISASIQAQASGSTTESQAFEAKVYDTLVETDGATFAPLPMPAAIATAVGESLGTLRATPVQTVADATRTSAVTIPGVPLSMCRLPAQWRLESDHSLSVLGVRPVENACEIEFEIDANAPEGMLPIQVVFAKGLVVGGKTNLLQLPANVSIESSALPQWASIPMGLEGEYKDTQDVYELEVSLHLAGADTLGGSVTPTVFEAVATLDCPGVEGAHEGYAKFQQHNADKTYAFEMIFPAVGKVGSDEVQCEILLATELPTVAFGKIPRIARVWPVSVPVGVVSTNGPPTIALPSQMTVKVGSAYDLAKVSSDPDKDSLDWSLGVQPNGAVALEGARLVFSEPGTFELAISVSDRLYTVHRSLDVVVESADPTPVR